MKKRVCIVTMTRAEYGVLKWIIKDMINSDVFEPTLIAGGAHFSKEQGYTVDEIKKDGIPFYVLKNSIVDNSDEASIVEGMGDISISVSKAFKELKPDYLVVVGDRYELLPVATGALIMKIPIIHISGGDVTEGAIDNEIRNAITMMATYHFTGNDESKKNIIRMRNSDENVWNVGEPGLDAFYREKLFDREEMAFKLGLDIDKKWILFTYHSETRIGLEENIKTVKNCIEVLKNIENIQCVMTHANMDFGGIEINRFLEEVADGRKLFSVASLGHINYLSMMRQVSLVMGNSSSGILEAPFLQVPVVNIGDRQKGRHLCGNVLDCSGDKSEIETAVYKAMNEKFLVTDSYYWGDGHAGKRMINILSDI
ncbi:MAG: UDP-N-acetylglucosamine 2-epimerase (hydrolyzing) [Lachnospiraceae bacterium]|nr:UDP-N-acetylglucosamine 2-epimerase (hydrolyzing) [Lachnospiraceae bacterium]